MSLFNQPKQSVPSNLLRDKYGWPPFSILNTRLKEWHNRRSEWEAIIGSSVTGRDTRRYNATPTNISSGTFDVEQKPESVSEFDPYLCELMYRWFSRSGDCVFDPFAGGCVRGIVASILGREYCGFDLSPKQVWANRAKFEEVANRYSGLKTCEWVICDSEVGLSSVCTFGKAYNMVFTCPPYYNLERYTHDPRDLSNLPTYDDFLNKYCRILVSSANALVNDSFFVIVVSEVRAEQQDLTNSQYLGLVPDTIQILRGACGLSYYNEIILENAFGSLPIRAPKSFNKTRKIGRHHQNVLVFYKGKIENIEKKFGSICL